MLRVRESDYVPGELISSWQVPLSWWESHTCADVRYCVRLQVDDSEVLNAAWRALAQRYTAHVGEIWVGGAFLRRLCPDVVEVVSGGEDALESLSWVINDDFIATVRDVGAGQEVHIRSLLARRIPLS